MKHKGYSLIEYAMDYHERGFSLIPIRLMDKRPLGEWAEFQKRRPTESEIYEWFKDGNANIGIVTGKISNLSVIDLDSNEAIEYFSNNDFPESPVVKTQRGFHIYYLYNSGIRTSVKINNMKIDLRSDGGYVVAPPSVNSMAIRYQWVEGYCLNDLPIADFPMGLLAPKDEQKKETSITDLYSGVTEGQRNASLARLMGSWLKDGLSLNDCLGMAHAWNSRNHPPLSDMEVVKTVTGLFHRYAAPNTVTVTDLNSKSGLTSLADLLAEPEENLPWVVKDTLSLGGSSIIVAKPKIGKSTITRQGMLSVARGEFFLNRETTPGPVIYLALEEKRSEVRRHFRDMGAIGNELIYIATSIGKQDPIAELKIMIAEVHAVWVVIDPLFKFIAVKDGNAYSEMSNAIERIHNLARDANIHITAIHHATKGNKSGGDGILGSTAIFGGIDSAIILKSDGTKRSIMSIQRYGVDIPETTLVFDATTRTTSLGASQATTTAVTLEQSIVSFLVLQTQPVSENVMNQNVTGDSGARSAALRNLVAAGTVVRTGAGKKGSPYLYAMKHEAPAPTPAPVIVVNPFEETVESELDAHWDEIFKPSVTPKDDEEPWEIQI